MQSSKDEYKNKGLRHAQQVLIEGLEPQLYKLIKSSGNNAQTIIDYTNSVRNEISVSYSYERNNIKALAYLSKFHSNKKFKTMDKDDILSFLNSYRKSEDIDPLHGWIATYNLYIVILGRFFKWLYHQTHYTVG